MFALDVIAQYIIIFQQKSEALAKAQRVLGRRHLGIMAAPAMPAARYKLISVPEAQQIVLSQAMCLPPKQAGLLEAVDRVLAEDVVSSENVPPFPASIKVGTYVYKVLYCKL